LGRGGEALAFLDDLARDPLMAGRVADIRIRRAGLAVWGGEVDEAGDALRDAAPSHPGLALELGRGPQAVDLPPARRPAALGAARRGRGTPGTSGCKRGTTIRWRGSRRPCTSCSRRGR